MVIRKIRPQTIELSQISIFFEECFNLTKHFFPSINLSSFFLNFLFCYQIGSHRWRSGNSAGHSIRIRPAANICQRTTLLKEKIAVLLLFSYFHPSCHGTPQYTSTAACVTLFKLFLLNKYQLLLVCSYFSLIGLS